MKTNEIAIPLLVAASSIFPNTEVMGVGTNGRIGGKGGGGCVIKTTGIEVEFSRSEMDHLRSLKTRSHSCRKEATRCHEEVESRLRDLEMARNDLSSTDRLLGWTHMFGNQTALNTLREARHEYFDAERSNRDFEQGMRDIESRIDEIIEHKIADATDSSVMNEDRSKIEQKLEKVDKLNAHIEKTLRSIAATKDSETRLKSIDTHVIRTADILGESRDNTRNRDLLYREALQTHQEAVNEAKEQIQVLKGRLKTVDKALLSQHPEKRDNKWLEAAVCVLEDSLPKFVFTATVNSRKEPPPRIDANDIEGAQSSLNEIKGEVVSTKEELEEKLARLDSLHQNRLDSIKSMLLN